MKRGQRGKTRTGSLERALCSSKDRLNGLLVYLLRLPLNGGVRVHDKASIQITRLTGPPWGLTSIRRRLLGSVPTISDVKV